MGLEMCNWEAYPRALLLGLWRVTSAQIPASLCRTSDGGAGEPGLRTRSIGEKCVSVRIQRRVRDWRGVFCTLFITFCLLSTVAEGCGPGRGTGRRRAPRKLTPLVYKQHVPNVQENALSASGLNEGKILRGDSQRFKELVPNYNTDIIFRDDEGTGADRLMTQRLKEKLNTLAISVMNQWPGVKLRVIEGWDEEMVHADQSLHYEGRALDLTTSDKDKSKYGMLARLAVEAGFDWVYYESRAHIHASVKSDAFQTGRSGGCFSANSTVLTKRGLRPMSSLRPGDEVLTIDSDGSTVFSPILLFLDRNGTEMREFYRIQTNSTSLTLTPSHLLYVIPAGTLPAYTLSPTELLALARPTFARNVEEGDLVLILDPTQTGLRPERILAVDSDMRTGVFAPLTITGNIVVDGMLSSCYALIDSQSLAHWSFLPIRLGHSISSGLAWIWNQARFLVTLSTTTGPERGSELLRRLSQRDAPVAPAIEDQGIYWYADLLYRATSRLLPAHWLYES